MKNKRVSWSLPAIAIIVLVYILTLFNWQAILPKVETASAKEEKAYVTPKTFADLQKADPAEVAKNESKFDGRKFGIKTNVKDQTGYNLCWAFAAAHTVEASLLRSGLVPLDYSTQLNIDALNLANNIFNWQPDPLGNTDDYEPLLTDWNRAGHANAPSQLFSQWRGLINVNQLGDYYKTRDYLGYDYNMFQLKQAVFLSNAYRHPNREEIKTAIAQYGAVGMNYMAQTSGSVVYWNYSKDTETLGLHGGSIIGWDDTISKENFAVKPKNDGAWIVKNSWGPHRGQEGYFYLSYEAEIAGLVAFDFMPDKTYHNNYFYDLATKSTLTHFIRQNSTKPLQAASIFEVKKRSASKKEYIKAVNVGIENDNVNCTVQVYTGISSLYANPTSGKLAVELIKTFQYGGFYTIDLEKNIDLDDSNYFSIVVKVENPTNRAGIVAERDDLSHNDFAYVYNETSKTWENSKYQNSNRIPRIKAYTVNEDRTTEIPNNLTFATVNMPTAKNRVDYNETAQCPDFSLEFKGQTLKKDEDYILTYKDNVLPGTATAIYTGIGQYTGTKLVNWTIVKPEDAPNIPGIKQNESSTRYFTVKENVTKYNQIPLPDGWRWLYDKDIAFDAIEDNYVQYNDGNYERTMYPARIQKDTSASATVNIATCTITMDTTRNTNTYEYTGFAIKPKVTVKNGGTTLVENVDYVLQYQNNIHVGTATVIIKGNGVNYSGENRITFTITKAQSPASRPIPKWEIGSNVDLNYLQWGDGWKLENPNESIQIGETKTITLIREDATNYVIATCTVTVTRLKTSSGGQVTPPNPAPSPNPTPNPVPTPSPDRPSVEKPEINTPSNTPTDSVANNTNANKSKIILWTAIGGVVVVGGVALVIVFKKKG